MVFRTMTFCTLRLASYRSFRDNASLLSSRAMGASRHQDKVFADLAFGVRAPASRSSASGTLHVGVGVMAWAGATTERSPRQRLTADYLGQMTELTASLVSAGHRVRILVGDADDGPTARAVVTAAGGTSDVVAVDFTLPTSSGEAFTQIADLDVVIGTRFHTVIYAVMLGKPVISLGYGEKHRDLMTRLGVTTYAVSVRDASAEHVGEAPGSSHRRRARSGSTVEERQCDAGAGGAGATRRPR